MGKIRTFFEKIGYYCPGCNRCKKVFAPPFGRRVCLSCQMEDADHHKAHLTDLISLREKGGISNSETYDRIRWMRDRYLQSKQEREESK